VLNRLLLTLVAVMVPLGLLLGAALWERRTPLSEAVPTSVAAVVSLVPEGLVLLASLTYAVAVLRMARRGRWCSSSTRSSRWPRSTSPASTRRARSPTARCASSRSFPRARPEGALARFAASATARNDTLQAIADSAAAAPQEPEAVVPFASRRRWSGLRLGGTDFVLGAPELFELGALGERADEEARDGRRVVAFGTSPVPLEEIDLDEGPPAFSPLAVILISERLRPEARATVEYFCRERAPRRRQQ
jgi:cation-transporting P-type ATPase E